MSVIIEGVSKSGSPSSKWRTLLLAFPCVCTRPVFETLAGLKIV